MNITVIANRDVASNFALNRLLTALAPRHRLCVFLSSQVGGVKKTPEELKQLKFFEQVLFNELLFPALQNSSRAARLLSFQALAQTLGIEIENLNKINSDESIACLAATHPDLLLSIRYGEILREEAIAIPPEGVLNLHSGLLPHYRGVMATFFAMLNGDSAVGTTLHSITDAGIDTGEVLSVTGHQLDYSHSYLWNVLQLYPNGVDMMLGAVEKISNGEKLQGKPQPGGGTYYSFPTPEQLHRFAEKGFRLYDVEEILEFTKQYLEP